jgi:hypothetical protein
MPRPRFVIFTHVATAYSTPACRYLYLVAVGFSGFSFYKKICFFRRHILFLKTKDRLPFNSH